VEGSESFEAISASAGGKLHNRDSIPELKSLPVLLAAAILVLPALVLASGSNRNGEPAFSFFSGSRGLGRKVVSQQPAGAAEEYKEITVRGRIICVDGSGRRLTGEGECDLHKQKLGFAAADGKVFMFWREDTLGAMLADPRVSKHLLQLIARLHLNNQLETIRIQAVREGKLYDLYYFCHVCNITAYAPGPCPCCYQELEFIERPATDG
jgi:hypothetical protein